MCSRTPLFYLKAAVSSGEVSVILSSTSYISHFTFFNTTNMHFLAAYNVEQCMHRISFYFIAFFLSINLHPPASG